MSERDLSGQVAIVTGASSGVGWLSAVRLAETGVRVCVTARRRSALERLRGEIEAAGGECLAVPGDVASHDDVATVVEGCVSRYGRVDMLVNNAAVQTYATFEDYTWDEIERVFDVTCFGYLRFARAVLPHMRRQGSGHIINVLSMLAVGSAPLLSSYTAAKHALLGWQECLSLELSGTGIAVSGILLPSVSTPMFDHAVMKLGRQPQPIPPTYDTQIAARAVVDCARKPTGRYVPVILQGTLMIWLQRLAPWLGQAILSRWGKRLQMRDEPRDPERGNLFEPVPEGVGPYGSVPPTPAWVRYAAGGALAALALSAASGLVAIGSALRRR